MLGIVHKTHPFVSTLLFHHYFLTTNLFSHTTASQPFDDTTFTSLSTYTSNVFFIVRITYDSLLCYISHL